MESPASFSGSHQHQQPQLPLGFRFHPTDEELVVHYLKKKASSTPLPVTIIAEIDLYKFDPWELPGKVNFGEQEWYFFIPFFSPRDRKYPNGARPNRAATSRYWKVTGIDKPILTSTSGGTQKVGVKKALVFYGGKPPKGIKTNCIMHEFCLGDSGARPSSFPNRKGSLSLDDRVLYRIYKKNGHARVQGAEQDESPSADEVMASLPSMGFCSRPLGGEKPSKENQNLRLRPVKTSRSLSEKILLEREHPLDEVDEEDEEDLIETKNCLNIWKSTILRYFVDNISVKHLFRLRLSSMSNGDSYVKLNVKAVDEIPLPAPLWKPSWRCFTYDEICSATDNFHAGSMKIPCRKDDPKL